MSYLRNVRHSRFYSDAVLHFLSSKNENVLKRHSYKLIELLDVS